MVRMPQSLMSIDVLHELMELLEEKEKLRQQLRARNFGTRVVHEDEARQLLSKIIGVTRELLNVTPPAVRDPEIILTRRYSELPRKMVGVSLVFISLGTLLMYFTLHYPDNDAAIWLVRLIIVFLFIFPLIFYRRVKLNIEHECTYMRDEKGTVSIVIDQLPAMQFQSYLAHEYAHHIYYEYFGREQEKWMREGWSRLVQWKVAEHLYGKEENPAYLYHVLAQSIGELKVLCEILALSLRIRLPSRIRRIRTMYKNNPLLNFITGSPGFDMNSLIEHGIGTGMYFTAERRMGLTRTLWKLPTMGENDIFSE